MRDKIDQLAKETSRLTSVELAFFKNIQGKTLLTPPQEAVFNKLYGKYCEDKWRDAYDDEKRRTMRTCALFYVNNPPKFSQLAAKALNDPDFVPTEEQYRGMCENKESRNLLEPDKATPLFPVGSLVRIGHSIHLVCRGKLAVVIRTRRDARVYPGPDSKFIYYILPQGMGNTIMLPEKDLTGIKLGETNES